MFNIDYTTAQTKIGDSTFENSQTGDINIFLQQPDTSLLTLPKIWGQTNLEINITNISADGFAVDLSNFIVEVYSDATASTLVGDMNILDYYQHSYKDDSGNFVHSTLWIITVDTLDFDNFNNYFLAFF